MVDYAEVKRYGGKWRIRYKGTAPELPEMNPEQVRIADLTGMDPMPEVGWTWNKSTQSFVPDSTSFTNHIPVSGQQIYSELSETAQDAIAFPENTAFNNNQKAKLYRMQIIIQIASIHRTNPRLTKMLDLLVTGNLITQQEMDDIVNR